MVDEVQIYVVHSFFQSHRAEINEKLIAPINPSVVVLGSTFVSPGEEGYDRLVANNGSSFYVGSQDAIECKGTSFGKEALPKRKPKQPSYR